MDVDALNISIELIPRDTAHLEAELELVQTGYASINAINIPDLLRLSTRSWEGAAQAGRRFDTCIPHIRAIDFNLKQHFGLPDVLDEHGIDQVLVVTGDPPQDMTRSVYPTTSLDLIRKLKQARPAMKVYGAIDPYRDNFRAEYDYIQRKLDAGVDGFFTQPFFDLRLMEVYHELMGRQEIYWGVSPVMSERSRNYWETKNNAIFPGGFEPTLEWNTRFARSVLDYGATTGTNVYLMPIKVDLKAYLDGIFGTRAE
ncbi:methylenetetrahydrofolate reductase [Paenibacillus methanolicus]|uniref:Methylenetetrahydrofolate reductase n=1 Tax=Paenibacillus methanolicus TaxID=582686 RepID=A0A5S5C6V2_9BACL|nr:methylenetetrahydrofolate reductase [Paenibacillus methanolicus]TYP74899.1 methylenetetrahydrofolate reductase (NADPH) [Paenibacillus methanolicus]